MNAERLQQIEELYHAALEREESQQAEFLRENCGADEVLRRQVESLLACGKKAQDVFELPAMELAARALARDEVRPYGASMSPGAVLAARYEILGELGQGGMGIVYKARDRETGEVLALKILKPEIAADLQILERFRNELRLAHKVTHRNVARLYEFHRSGDAVYLSMEYVEGESLRTLLQRIGKLDVARCLDMARQLAAGLAEAHRQSIAHRDLKPENIMLAAGGELKVMDFGICRSYGGNVTVTGGVIGTPAYMAPEQVEGRPADHRTDIYAFGLVLYEMFTGTSAFRAETPVALALKQIREPPQPPRRLAPELPVHVEQAILKCLEKDPTDRFQSVVELLRGLEGEPFPTARKRSLRAWLLGAIPATLAAAVVFYQGWKPASPPAQPTHKQITFVGDADHPAISPDGKSVAYVTGKEGQGQRLMVQDVKGGGAIELSKASSLLLPRWSPDGSELSIASSAPSSGVIVIPRLGGSARFIAEGAYTCWSPDGRQIAVAFQHERGFRIVDKVTGSVKSISLNGFQWFHDLDWSPVANLLAVWVESENGRNAIWTVHPDGSQPRKVREEDVLGSPRWSATGDGIYFLRGKGDTAEISKVSINAKSGEAKGPPSVLLNGLQIGDYFTISRDGIRLAYSRAQSYSNLWSAEFKGSDKGGEMQTRPLTNGTSKFDSLSISPDGKWIAFATGQAIYKLPIEGGTRPQLTLSDVSHVQGTAWSPDGKRIAFGSDAGGAYKVWIVDADGANRRQLAKTQLSSSCEITWSPGRHILYQRPGNRNFNILDPETGEEKPLVPDESVGWIFNPKYSPDGKKVAVYWNRRLQPQAGLWVISLLDNSATPLSSEELAPAGWLSPAGWSPDGRSLYAFGDHIGKRVISVSAEGGSPHTVFTLPGDVAEAVVSPDGRKFVSIVAEEKSDVWLVENFDPSHKK